MDGKADGSLEMPLGLSFRLGMNSRAMEAYAKMNDEEKLRVVEAAKNAASKSEMERIVAGLEQKFC